MSLPVLTKSHFCPIPVFCPSPSLHPFKVFPRCLHSPPKPTYITIKMLSKNIFALLALALSVSAIPIAGESQPKPSDGTLAGALGGIAGALTGEGNLSPGQANGNKGSGNPGSGDGNGNKDNGNGNSAGNDAGAGKLSTQAAIHATPS